MSTYTHVDSYNPATVTNYLELRHTYGTVNPESILVTLTIEISEDITTITVNDRGHFTADET